jgi:2-hydroxy-6-oxonona-2,4-dienedioate hydrolase
VAAPTLLVWGDRDELARRSDQVALVVAIEGARLVVYEDCGHAPHWEAPGRFAADLATFAASLAGATTARSAQAV